MDSFVYKPNKVPEFRRMKRTVMRNVIEMHVATDRMLEYTHERSTVKNIVE